MIVAIDFDKTWTEDPALWSAFCDNAVSRGHSVIMATGRKGRTSDMDRYLLGWRKIPIVYCGDTPKRQACLKAGWSVDIWIDDMPAMVDGALLINSDEEL